MKYVLISLIDCLTIESTIKIDNVEFPLFDKANVQSLNALSNADVIFVISDMKFINLGTDYIKNLIEINDLKVSFSFDLFVNGYVPGGDKFYAFMKMIKDFGQENVLACDSFLNRLYNLSITHKENIEKYKIKYACYLGENRRKSLIPLNDYVQYENDSLCEVYKSLLLIDKAVGFVDIGAEIKKYFSK